MRATLRWMRRAGYVVRRVIGAPDYERYLAHMRRAHPECTPLSHDRFIAAQLQSRYERPGSRCC